MSSITIYHNPASRPSEGVLEILANPQMGAFSKEDGEAVVNDKGQRV
jgi:arsenate reductase